MPMSDSCLLTIEMPSAIRMSQGSMNCSSCVKPLAGRLLTVYILTDDGVHETSLHQAHERHVPQRWYGVVPASLVSRQLLALFFQGPHPVLATEVWYACWECVAGIQVL